MTEEKMMPEEIFAVDEKTAGYSVEWFPFQIDGGTRYTRSDLVTASFDSMNDFRLQEIAVLRAKLEAADGLVKALEYYLMFENTDGESENEKFERIASVFEKQTGFLRPGKDCITHSPESRQMEWGAWLNNKAEQAKQALAKFKSVAGEK